MRKIKVLAAIVLSVTVLGVTYRSYQSYLVRGLSSALMQEVEALTDCDVTAKAKKGVLTVASAVLVCKGKGTCCIPENEFGLTATCSGKMVTYDLYVLGKKVN
jgi:hypothetical protein